MEYPALFSSLVLVDAFIVPEFLKHQGTNLKNETLTLGRPYLWPSRCVVQSHCIYSFSDIHRLYVESDKAAKYLFKSAYYRTWDPEALQTFIQYALVDLSDTDSVNAVVSIVASIIVVRYS